jgi:transposase
MVRDRLRAGWEEAGGQAWSVAAGAAVGCRPLASAGQRHDCLAFVPLTGQLRIARRCPGRPRTRPGRVLCGTACSSAAIRGHLRRRGIKAVIPRARGPGEEPAAARQPGRPPPPAFDAAADKQRNTVERAFCQLRQFRAVATRYGKPDHVWPGNRRRGLDPDLAPPPS